MSVCGTYDCKLIGNNTGYCKFCRSEYQLERFIRENWAECKCSHCPPKSPLINLDECNPVWTGKNYCTEKQKTAVKICDKVMNHSRKYYDFGPYRTSINYRFNNIPCYDTFIGFCDCCNGYKCSGDWNGISY